MVINASTSRVNEDLAQKYGTEITRTKVGEIHVAKKMREIGAVIGGEGNGGVILPDVYPGLRSVTPLAYLYSYQTIWLTEITNNYLNKQHRAKNLCRWITLI